MGRTKDPALPNSQASCSEAGSVGRKETRGCPGIVSQSQAGEAVCSVLRAVWGRKDDG